MRRLLAALAILLGLAGSADAQIARDCVVYLCAGSRPALDLNLAAAGAFPSTVTFTRASTATYTNGAGILATASSGVPRFVYDPVALTPLGYLSEAAATNIQLHSQFDTGWSVFGGTLTANNVTSPDGAVDGATFTEDTAAGPHGTNLTATTVITANTVYTGSMWLKAGTRTNAVLSLENSGPTDAVRVNVDLSACTVSAGSVLGTGVITGTPASQRWPNGWCRVFIAGTINAASTQAFLIPYGANPAGTISYTGTGATFQAFGADVKIGFDYSSYIPTTTATVTRSADSASIAGGSLPISQTGGTLVVSVLLNSQPVPNFARLLSLVGANVNTDEASIYTAQVNTNLNAGMTVAAAGPPSSPSTTIGSFPPGSRAHVAYSFTASRLALAVNGVAASTPNTVNTVGLPIFTSLVINGAVRFQVQASSIIKSVQYYRNAVSDSALLRLSAP